MTTPVPTSGTISAFLANATSIPAKGFSISDTSTNIALNLNALESKYTKINSLTQSDTGIALSISAKQLTADNDVLALLNAGSYTLNLTGVTAANLDTATLINLAYVTSFTLDIGVTTLSYTEYFNANGKLATNGLTITGVAAANAATVAADSNVSQLTLADTTLTALQYTSQVANKNSTLNLSITDVSPTSAASVTDSHVTSIAVTGATNANLASAALGLLVKVTSIALASGLKSLSYTEYNNAGYINSQNKLATSGLIITGVAATNAATVAANNNVSSLTLTTTALTAAQYSAVASKNTTPGLVISGVAAASAANVAADSNVSTIGVTSAAATDLDNAALGALAKVTSIALASGVKSLSYAEYNNAGYINSQSKLATSGLIITDVAVAKAKSTGTGTLASDTNVTKIAVTDVLATDLDTPSSGPTLGGVTKVSSIALAIGLTSLSYAEYTNANGKLITSALTVTDVMASNAATLAQDSKVQSIAVTGALASDLDNSALGALSKVTSIDLKSGLTSLSYAEYQNAQGKLLTTDLTITAVSAANADTVAQDAHVLYLTLNVSTLTSAQYTTAVAAKNTSTGLAITDVAADNAAALVADANISQIFVTNALATDIVSNTSVWTSDQVKSITLASGVNSLSNVEYEAANGKLDTKGLTITDVAAANTEALAALQVDDHVTKIAVIEATTADLSGFDTPDSKVKSIALIDVLITDLDAPLVDVANITSITLAVDADGNAVTILNYEEYTNANGKLAIINGGFTINDVLAANAARVAADSNVSNLTLLDPTILTATQYTSDVANKNTTAGLTINGVTAANAVTMQADPNVKAITLTGVIATDLDTDTLGVLDKATSIALANGLNSLSYAEYTNANGKLLSSGLTITGVTVASAESSGTGTLASDTKVTKIGVAGVFATDLDTTVLGKVTKVNSIALDPSVTSLSYTEYGYANGKLTTNGLTITGVTASNAAIVAKDTKVNFIAVTGTTAANLATPTLSLMPKVSMISLISGLTSLSYAEYANANSKLITSGLTITGVSVANASTVAHDSYVLNLTLTATVLTAAQYTTEVAAKNKTTGLTINGVSATNATILQIDPNVVNIAVTGAIATDLDTSTLGALNKVSSITLSSEVTSLSYAEYQNANSKLVGTSLTITNVAVANATTLQADTHVLAIAVTGATTADLTALATLNKVTSIALIGVLTTDLDTATLGNLKNVSSMALANGLSSLSYIEYANANHKLAASGLTVTGVAAANLVTLAADPNVSHLTLAAPTLTAAQYTSAVATKNTTSGLTITGVTASNAAAVTQDSKVNSIAVTGVLATDLDTNTLGTMAKVSAINLATGVTSLSYAEYANANSKLATSGLTISGVAVSDAATVAKDNNVAAIAATGVTTANLDTAILGSLAKVTSITLATGVTNLSYTEYANANGKLASSGLTITTVPATDAAIAALAADNNVSHLTLAATATTLTEAQYTTVAAKNMSTGLTVSNTKAGDAAYLAAAADTNVTSITLAAGGTNLSLADYLNANGKLATSGLTIYYVALADAALILSDHHISSITIYDTSTNISAYFDILVASSSLISDITIADGNPVIITPAQAFSNSSVLKLIQYNGGNYNGSYITVMPISGSVFTFFANIQYIDPTIPYAYAIFDTAANLAANLDGLETSYNLISSITISDSNSLSINAAQFLSDGDVLLKFTATAKNLYIIDTAAHITATLDLLEPFSSFITGITISDSNALTVNIAQLINDATLLNKISNGKFLYVTDTSDNISANLDILAAGAKNITGIAISDSQSLVITSTQLSKDSSALNIIANGKNVSIVDTAANITANLDVLAANAKLLSSITISDSNSVSVNTAQLSKDASALAKISAYGYLAINDTAANIAANLDLLAANAKYISGITITDSNPLSINATQASKDASALIFISNTNNNNLVITDTAKNLNNLNLSAYHGKQVDLIVTSLNANMTVLGGAVTELDLSRLLNANFKISTLNNGADTKFDVSSNGVTQSIELLGETPNNIKVDASYSANINTISSVGASPDGSILLLTFSSGATTSIPYANGTGSIAMNGTTYTTANLESQATLAGAQNIPVVFTEFASAATASISYILPTVYTGPVQHLNYQLIDSTPNVAILGTSSNDFIKLSNTKSAGKAVNGNGGSDVIDAGVGSNFISGGNGHTGDTFFLDGRAAGTSWSTITDFNFGNGGVTGDIATIWGFVMGVSSIDTTFSDANTGGADGWKGLTLHFDNLLPDGKTSGSNSSLNSITLSGHNLLDLGVSSIAQLNYEIAHSPFNAGTGQYLVNSHILIGQTSDALGMHSYLYIH